jgi:uracil-DNA glycosylase
MGVSAEEFYDEARIAIVPMGFCFPGLDAKGGDRPPRAECAPAWRAQVFRHLPNVALILMIGRHAQAWHMPDARGRPLGDVVAGWRSALGAGELPRRVRPASYLTLQTGNIPDTIRPAS